MKLRLIRNADAFSIITKTAAEYKIKVLDLRLLVRKIKPSQDIVNHHQRLFNTKNAVFPFHQTKITQHLIPAGAANAQIPVHSGILPKQVFSVLLKHSGFIPDETKNPFVFPHNNLTSFVYKLNGLQLSDRFDLNFDTNQYIRAYRNLIDSIGVGSGNAGCDLTLADFKTGACILALDLTPDFCSKYK